LSRNGYILFDHPDADERAVAHSLVKEGMPLELASLRLRDHSGLVLRAVSIHGMALEFASLRLRDCGYIVWTAVNSYGWSFQFGSERLRSSFQIALAAVSNDPFSLQFADKSLRDNEEIVETAIRDTDGESFCFASDALRHDKRFLKRLVVENPDLMLFIPDKIKHDEGFIADLIASISHTIGRQRLFPLIPETLRSNYEFVRKCVGIEPSFVAFISEELKDDLELFLYAVKLRGDCFKYSSMRLRSLRLVASTAFSQSGLSYQFGSEVIRDDRSLLMMAMDTYWPAFEFASERLRNDPIVLNHLKYLKMKRKNQCLVLDEEDAEEDDNQIDSSCYCEGDDVDWQALDDDQKWYENIIDVSYLDFEPEESD